MRALNSQKHRHMGFYFDFEDYGTVREAVALNGLSGKNIEFSDYGPSAAGGMLRVYRDVNRKPTSKAVVDSVAESDFTPDEIRVLKSMAKKVLDAEKMLKRLEEWE